MIKQQPLLFSVLLGYFLILKVVHFTFTQMFFEQIFVFFE